MPISRESLCFLDYLGKNAIEHDAALIYFLFFLNLSVNVNIEFKMYLEKSRAGLIQLKIQLVLLLTKAKNGFMIFLEHSKISRQFLQLSTIQ